MCWSLKNKFDWLWRSAQADLDRAAGRTDGWGAPLVPAEEGAVYAQADGDGNADDGGAIFEINMPLIGAKAE